MKLSASILSCIPRLFSLLERCQSSELSLVQYSTTDNSYKGRATSAPNAVFILSRQLTTFKTRYQAYCFFHQRYLSSPISSVRAYYRLVIEHLAYGGQLPSPAVLKSKSDLINGFSSILNLIYHRLDIEFLFFALRLNLSRTRLLMDGSRRILITGWYGTETHGDKAILLEIIHFYRKRFSNIEIGITSIFPEYTRFTLDEIGHSEITIIPLGSISSKELQKYDSIVFGGGPLMTSGHLRYIRELFKWGYRNGRKTVIFGCGVGPFTSDLTQRQVTDILRYSEILFFRDVKSKMIADELLNHNKRTYFACDPALSFVSRWKRSRRTSMACSHTVSLLLRKQTAEYCLEHTQQRNMLVSTQLAEFCKYLHYQKGLTLQPTAMNSFWYGGDDQQYFDELIEENELGDVFLDTTYKSIYEVLETIAGSSIGLAMRYHGHLFLIALDKPYISVDYTKGGKVTELMDRYETAEQSVCIDSQAMYSDLVKAYAFVESQRTTLQRRISRTLDNDLKQLQQVYDSLEF